MLTTFFDRVLGAETWLQGPKGPPFFLAALFMGLMYGGIGLSQRTAVGFLPFAVIAGSLLVLERIMDGNWVNIVVVIYVLAVWGAIAAIGWRQKGWKSSLAAVGGALLAYGIFSIIPFGNTPWRPGYLPQLHVLVDGVLTGAGIGLGRFYARRNA